MSSSYFGRAATVAISMIIGGLIIWRGHTYADLSGGGGGVLTPLMCSLFGLFCFLTGVALACRDGETEATE
jgi:hypothetical protein